MTLKEIAEMMVPLTRGHYAEITLSAVCDQHGACKTTIKAYRDEDDQGWYTLGSVNEAFAKLAGLDSDADMHVVADEDMGEVKC